MSFLAPVFWIFLGLVLVAVLMLRGRPRLWFLTLASYFFYAWSYPPYVLILLLSTVMDYILGRCMDAAEEQSKRRRLLVISLTMNLGLLCFFKYTVFLLSNVNGLLPWDFPVPEVLLPVGISFYTFQTLSYTIDVYRREIKAEKNFMNFAMFVAFFPQLVAGPIVRAKDFLPQINSYQPLLHPKTREGIELVLIGLFKKAVIADNLAPFVERIYSGNPMEMGGAVLWLGTIAFALQIYGDFSGYSDIARGIAKILGFEFCINFRWPYLAQGISDFWRRWHISLSTWLRDYLYFSLGGSRVDARWKEWRNLFIVWFLGGLWHGASWTYVCWGLWHGLMVSLGHTLSHTRLGALWERWPTAFKIAITFAIVCLGWVFFRAASVKKALYIQYKMLWPFHHDWLAGIDTLDHWTCIVLFSGLALHAIGAKLYGAREFLAEHWHPAIFVGATVLMLLCILLLAGSSQGFIYFQF